MKSQGRLCSLSYSLKSASQEQLFKRGKNKCSSPLNIYIYLATNMICVEILIYGYLQYRIIQRDFFLFLFSWLSSKRAYSHLKYGTPTSV